MVEEVIATVAPVIPAAAEAPSLAGKFVESLGVAVLGMMTVFAGLIILIVFMLFLLEFRIICPPFPAFGRRPGASRSSNPYVCPPFPVFGRSPGHPAACTLLFRELFPAPGIPAVFPVLRESTLSPAVPRSSAAGTSGCCDRGISIPPPWAAPSGFRPRKPTSTTPRSAGDPRSYGGWRSTGFPCP